MDDNKQMASGWRSARARARGGKLMIKDDLKPVGNNEHKGKGRGGNLMIEENLELVGDNKNKGKGKGGQDHDQGLP